MEKRALGASPLKVSAIGLGLMSMSGIYGNADDGESISLIHNALDRGVDHLDSSDMYGWGHNEQLLGRALKGRRDQAIVVTKFGQTRDASGKQGVDGRPEYVMRACEASLKRLGIEVIDLYYQHRVDPAVPIEETVGALDELRRAGKIKHIGLSEAGPETLARAARVAPITALQSEYSIWERDVEDEILPVCRANGIGFVPYSPLGRGFLTGQIKARSDLPEGDWRLQDPRYSEENFAANLKIVDVVRTIADAHNVSPAQIALAWLLAQGDDVVPIPGSKRRATMEDSVAAAEVTLTASDLAAIDAAAPRGGTAGPRYGERGMRMVRL
jgi:aryl-alcohol dehydrogenase-like predicted oxidoreductase